MTTTATTQLTQTRQYAQIRPLNPRRDLTRVADLIELCFAETLDQDGQRYLQRMRQVGQKNEGRWFDATPLRVNMTAEGFVWQENGRIIGNISLIPFTNLRGPLYLIANVAVHPDYRRKGIARALTNAALKQARQQHARAIWLQVRDNNLAAVKLYESLGFIERARRTTWTLLPGNLKGGPAPNARVLQHAPPHWKNHKQWLLQNYPAALFWYWPLTPNAFRPGFLGMFIRLLHETEMRQWRVEQQGQLRGILSWKASHAYADQLWLATPPGNENLVLKTLLPHIHWRERARRPLAIDYPAGQATSTFHEMGFTTNHTLIWMEI